MQGQYVGPVSNFPTADISILLGVRSTPLPACAVLWKTTSLSTGSAPHQLNLGNHAAWSDKLPGHFSNFQQLACRWAKMNCLSIGWLINGLRPSLIFPSQTGQTIWQKCSPAFPHRISVWYRQRDRSSHNKLG